MGVNLRHQYFEVLSYDAVPLRSRIRVYSATGQGIKTSNVNGRRPGCGKMVNVKVESLGI